MLTEKASLQTAAYRIAAELTGVDIEILADDSPYMALPFRLSDMMAKGVEQIVVGYPHTDHAMNHVSSLTATARETRSVNVLTLRQDKLEGHDTKPLGLNLTLNHIGGVFAGKRALVCGIDAAAKAAALVCSTWKKMSTFVLNPIGLGDKDHAATGLRVPEGLFDLVVNVGPNGHVGDYVNKTPLEAKFLHDQLLVVDLNYNPRETVLLREARAAGARVYNGVLPAAFRAMGAFNALFGMNPPQDEYIRRVLEASQS